MFVNFSNHSSSAWDESQLNEAHKYGDIVDIAFPQVQPSASEPDIESIAEKYSEMITGLEPEAVMCQGEFTLCFSVVNKLKENHIKVVAACSERKSVEKHFPDGTTQKTAVFAFVKFREY